MHLSYSMLTEADLSPFLLRNAKECVSWCVRMCLLRLSRRCVSYVHPSKTQAKVANPTSSTFLLCFFVRPWRIMSFHDDAVKSQFESGQLKRLATRCMWRRLVKITSAKTQ